MMAIAVMWIGICNRNCGFALNRIRSLRCSSTYPPLACLDSYHPPFSANLKTTNFHTPSKKWVFVGEFMMDFSSGFMMIFAESRLGWLNTAGKNPEKFREDVFHASRCATPNFCWSSATCAWQKKSSKDLKTAEENDALWESRKDNSCQTSELKTGKNMLKHHICSKICFLKIVLRSSLLWIGIKTCLFAEELPLA